MQNHPPNLQVQQVLAGLAKLHRSDTPGSTSTSSATHWWRTRYGLVRSSGPESEPSSEHRRVRSRYWSLPSSAAHTARSSARRSAANTTGLRSGVSCSLTETVTECRPSSAAAANWVYPGVLPVCP